MEIFKDIPGFGDYKVSKLGNVKSFRYSKYSDGKMLKPVLRSDGYLVVTLYKEGKEKKKKIHRLVAETFIPNPLKKKTVNHKDGNKQNNNISNLEWATVLENIIHAKKNDLNVRGEKQWKSKLTEKQIVKIRMMRFDECCTYKYIADKFNISQSHVYDIINKKYWNHI